MAAMRGIIFNWRIDSREYVIQHPRTSASGSCLGTSIAAMFLVKQITFLRARGERACASSLAATRLYL